MSFYDDRIRGKKAEEILAIAGSWAGGVWPSDEGELLRVAAQVRTTQHQIEAQDNATRHLVDCTSTIVAVQKSSVHILVAGMDRLTASIEQASDDSGKLGTKIVILTGALGLVGLGQIVATAWPYLAWWWHH